MTKQELDQIEEQIKEKIKKELQEYTQWEKKKTKPWK